MAISKKSAIIGGVFLALSVTGIVIGGIALQKNLTNKYGSDVEAEEEKVFLVGTWKEIDGHQPKVMVSLLPKNKDAVTRQLSVDEMNFNTSGQTDVDSCWINLSSWLKESIGDVRIDEWCNDGGVITFSSSCGGATSAKRYVSFGGGAYFVEAPVDGETQTVIHTHVSLYIPEADL